MSSTSQDATPPSAGGYPQSGSGGLDTGTRLVESLDEEPLLATAPRVSVAGRPVPVLGSILILSRLGRGGMGAVFAGLHERLRKDVAVKVLPFHLAGLQPEFIERFYREAQIAARVQSPHLVAVTDVNQEKGLYYLVMEYVNGTTAGAILKQTKAEGRKGLPEAVALEIILAATTGLSAAHAHGVIHRDVKPENILIPRRAGALEGEATFDYPASKLADLGLARSEDVSKTLTATNACLGTPGYMSPEQADSARSAGKPADIFSMGASLYALLSGHAPFTGSALLQVLNATCSKPHAPIRGLRPDVTPATSELLDRCLEKDPARRYADAAELLGALKACRDRLGALDVTKLVPPSEPAPATPAQATPIYVTPVHATPMQVAPRSSPAYASTPPPAQYPQAATPMPSAATPVSRPLPAAPQSAWTPAPARQRMRTGQALAIAAAVAVFAVCGTAYFLFVVKEKERNEAAFQAALKDARAAKPESLDAAITTLETWEQRKDLASGDRTLASQMLEELRGKRQRLRDRERSFEGLLADAARKADDEPDAALALLAKAEAMGREDAGAGLPELSAKPTLSARRGEIEAARVRRVKLAQDQLEEAKRQREEAQRQQEGTLRHALAAGYQGALDAKKGGQWNNAVRALEGPLAALGKLDDPLRPAAEALLEEARKNIAQELASAAALALLRKEMAAKNWVAARDALDNAAEKGVATDVLKPLRAEMYTGLREDARTRLRSSNVETQASAVKDLRLAAAQNDPEAQVLLGDALHLGRGVPRDHKEAASWYRKASEAGFARAHARLGRMYYFAFGVVCDLDRAHAIFRKGSEAGDPLATALLAQCYLSGRSVARDDAEAERLFKHAIDQDLITQAEAGDPIGQTLYGFMWENGKGVHISPMFAMDYFKRAAKQGEPVAMYNLGFKNVNPSTGEPDYAEALKWFVASLDAGCLLAKQGLAHLYGNGLGVPKDPAKAVRLFREAAELKHVFALASLGEAYLHGRGVAEDFMEAAKWLQPAAEAGDGNSQYFLAWLYCNGKGVAKDERKALYWAERSAQQGNANGQYFLALLNRDGIGVAANPAEALRLFHAAAEKGVVDAQGSLAWAYYWGIGAEKNGAEAFKWAQPAAKGGSIDGHYILGLCYAYGVGTAVNEEEGIKSLLESAKKGHMASQAELSYLYMNTKNLPHDFREAFRWAKTSAEQGSDVGQLNLGVLYETGQGGVKNEAEAFKWCMASAKQGNTMAQTKVGYYYVQGIGTAKDDNEGMSWFLTSAQKGDGAGQAGLAVKYIERQQYAEAFKWAAESSKNGNPVGQMTLGLMYENGLGIQKNKETAKAWYRKSAQAGFELARKRLEDLGE